jgi:HYR domain
MTMKVQLRSQQEAASRRRRAYLVLVASLALATGATQADARTSAPRVAAGTFALQAELSLSSQRVVCPPGAPTETCAAQSTKGLVAGLGSVSAQYYKFLTIGPPSCAENFGRTLAYPIRLVVAAKGEIQVTLAAAADCVESGTGALRTQAQAFTVTGGTGIYAGASGTGTVESTLGEEGPRGHFGSQTWKGTLSVAGLEFDTSPPTISGAVAKIVRAPRGVKRVRVTYAVTASDDVEGQIPVSCDPKSGSRFALGRTMVTCSATDTSGNGRTAKFTVTVKRRR